MIDCINMKNTQKKKKQPPLLIISTKMPLRVWPLGSSVIEKDIHHFSHPVAYLKLTKSFQKCLSMASCSNFFYLSIEWLNKWNWYCTDCWDWGWCVPANQNWSWHVCFDTFMFESSEIMAKTWDLPGLLPVQSKACIPIIRGQFLCNPFTHLSIPCSNQMASGTNHLPKSEYDEIIRTW